MDSQKGYISMKRETKKEKLKETIIYYEGVPEQVIEELSESQRVQYFIWDEMIKRMSRLHPEILLPVIKEIFGREYPEGVKIEFLSTEYAVDTSREKGQNILHSIYADLVVKIGEKDVYHLECQISPKRNMMIRMYEYDSQIALVHGVGIHHENQKTFLEMPSSVILYLTHTEHTPEHEILQIRLPNGIIWEYKVPALKVQNYTLDMIKEKQLYFLIPLSTIRYYSRKTKKRREDASKPFAQFLQECIQVISGSVREGYLSQRGGKDVLDFLNRGCQYLFAKDVDTLKEVQIIMEPVFKLGREIFEEEATERITQEVTERVTQQITQEVTQQVTQQVTEQVTQQVTQQVTEQVTQQVTEQVTQQVTEQVTQQVTQQVTEQVTQQVTEQVTQRGIKEFIIIEQEEGTEKAAIKRKLQRIFKVSESEAEEKMELYYN